MLLVCTVVPRESCLIQKEKFMSSPFVITLGSRPHNVQEHTKRNVFGALKFMIILIDMHHHKLRKYIRD